MIPQNVIDDILSAAKVEEVVGEYVNLKKRGTNWVGLCPFHDEKTPSFYVSPSKEIYKCFGCGKAGNSVRFLMDHEKFTYPEALRYLAKKYRIEIKEDEETEEDKLERDEIASLHIVLNFAAEFYHNYLLTSEEGKNIGLEYLKTRQISNESIKDFQIGLSPTGFDVFTKEALKHKYKEEYLIASGLSIKTHKGNLIDRFRERIMFPIISQSGRTIGFGGRTLKSDPKEAKYINSPETKVYSKSNSLYGLYPAKQGIRQNDEVILVEGYTDVIGMHQAGIENTVAALGTSLTPNHLSILKRYTNNITFVFDGDAAGMKASMRAIDIALEEEFNTKAISLPDGEDPDSFTKSHTNIQVQDFFESNKKDFILFKTSVYLDNGLADPIQRADVIKNIIESVSKIPNNLKRSLYIKDLSRILSIEEETLYSELNKLILGKSAPRQRTRKSKQEKQKKALLKTSSPTTIEQEKIILKHLINYGRMEYENGIPIAEKIIETIEQTEWDDAVCHSVFNAYVDYFTKHGEYPDISYFINHEKLEFQDFASAAIIIHEEISNQWEERYGKNIDISHNYVNQVKSSIYHFELRKLQALKHQNLIELQKSDLSEKEIEIILETEKFLTSEINRISREIKLVIY